MFIVHHNRATKKCIAAALFLSGSRVSCRPISFITRQNHRHAVTVFRFVEIKQARKKADFSTKRLEELVRDHIILEKVSHHYFYSHCQPKT